MLEAKDEESKQKIRQEEEKRIKLQKEKEYKREELRI